MPPANNDFLITYLCSHVLTAAAAVFCILNFHFVFGILYFEFCILHFVFGILQFAIWILHFVFWILHFVFCIEEQRHFAGHFFYSGSLTTPPCSENVLWIVFDKPIVLSEEQVSQFVCLLFSPWYICCNFNFRWQNIDCWVMNMEFNSWTTSGQKLSLFIALIVENLCLRDLLSKWLLCDPYTSHRPIQPLNGREVVYRRGQAK